MSRGGHYGFERRRRADIQKAKQEAKRQRKTERAESGVIGPEIGEAQDTGAPPACGSGSRRAAAAPSPQRPKTRPAPDPPDDWVLLTDVEPDTRPE